MKFNSQICTTRSQSERLLALGLKKETADMVWSGLSKDPICQPYNKIKDLASDLDDKVHPSWSLHRLIEILGVSKMIFNIDLYDSPYEELIHRIDIFINTGVFNKEYLEE